MAKEENNSTTSQTNHDFVPNQVRMNSLTKLKTFCETEVDICNRVIEMLQNPNKESVSQDFLKKENEINQEITRYQNLVAQDTTMLEKAKLDIKNLNPSTDESQKGIKEHEAKIRQHEAKIRQHEANLRYSKDSLQKSQEQLSKLQQQENKRKSNEASRRQNWQEAIKDPNHQWTAWAQGILERQKVASEALEFINQAIKKENEYYSVERRDRIIDAQDIISRQHYTEYSYNYWWTMKDKQNSSQQATDFDNLISYAINQNMNKSFKIFLKNAEKLAKARNDDERYQPLKDIMDAMIIMIAKASSMFMPPAVIDITIKALGSIGGHLADIIKEDFEKIRKQPNNSAELTELTKKQEELGKSIDNSIKAAQSTQMILGFALTETAKKLGVAVGSQKEITEAFIKTLEQKIETIQTNLQENQTLNLSAEELQSLCEQATKNITIYRNAQTALDNMQKEKAKLDNIKPNVEQTNKSPERKSIKDMRSELKNKRDATFKDTVRKQQQEYQKKFNTK